MTYEKLSLLFRSVWHLYLNNFLSLLRTWIQQCPFLCYCFIPQFFPSCMLHAQYFSLTSLSVCAVQCLFVDSDYANLDRGYFVTEFRQFFCLFRSVSPLSNNLLSLLHAWTQQCSFLCYFFLAQFPPSFMLTCSIAQFVSSASRFLCAVQCLFVETDYANIDWEYFVNCC